MADSYSKPTPRRCVMCRHDWTPRSWRNYRCPRCGAWDRELKAAVDAKRRDPAGRRGG